MSTTNLIKQEIYELEMYLDASLSGWGGGGAARERKLTAGGACRSRQSTILTT